MRCRGAAVVVAMLALTATARAAHADGYKIVHLATFGDLVLPMEAVDTVGDGGLSDTITEGPYTLHVENDAASSCDTSQLGNWERFLGDDAHLLQPATDVAWLPAKVQSGSPRSATRPGSYILLICEPWSKDEDTIVSITGPADDDELHDRMLGMLRVIDDARGLVFNPSDPGFWGVTPSAAGWTLARGGELDTLVSDDGDEILFEIGDECPARTATEKLPAPWVTVSKDAACATYGASNAWLGGDIAPRSAATDAALAAIDAAFTTATAPRDATLFESYNAHLPRGLWKTSRSTPSDDSVYAMLVITAPGGYKLTLTAGTDTLCPSPSEVWTIVSSSPNDEAWCRQARLVVALGAEMQYPVSGGIGKDVARGATEAVLGSLGPMKRHGNGAHLIDIWAESYVEVSPGRTTALGGGVSVGVPLLLVPVFVRIGGGDTSDGSWSLRLAAELGFGTNPEARSGWRFGLGLNGFWLGNGQSDPMNIKTSASGAHLAIERFMPIASVPLRMRIEGGLGKNDAWLTGELGVPVYHRYSFQATLTRIIYPHATHISFATAGLGIGF